MNGFRRWSSLPVALLLATATTVCAVTCATPAAGVTLLLAEDFDGLPLQTSPTYGVPNAFTPAPPQGWDVVSNIGGQGFPGIGVPEWEGWSFADSNFWKTVGGGSRTDFDLATGTIAVADPDLYNSDGFGEPAQRFGYYNTLLQTPPIPLSLRGATDDRLVLTFDTAWDGGVCCDDGELLPSGQQNLDNQAAFVRVRIDGGQWEEVLRWEAAPFLDSGGSPTNNPTGAQGTPNPQNPFFTPPIASERLHLDLQTVLDSNTPAVVAGFGNQPLSSAATGGSIEVEFGVEGAGDDGFWAIDNVAMASFTTLLGDMDLSGVIDAPDVDAYALGLLDETEYRFSYYGEFPSTRGSVDSTLDLDDIPWFAGVIEGAGLATTTSAATKAIAWALVGVPEPSAALLSALGVIGLADTRRALRASR
ncbi:MAG: hypothetical protein AAF805_03235 [Planctomycetota bacterium]